MLPNSTAYLFLCAFTFSGNYFKKSHSQAMMYPFIPIGLLVLLVLYILYLLVVKKDKRKLKAVLYPSLFFIVVWAVLYYFLLWK